MSTLHILLWAHVTDSVSVCGLTIPEKECVYRKNWRASTCPCCLNETKWWIQNEVVDIEGQIEQKNDDIKHLQIDIRELALKKKQEEKELEDLLTLIAKTKQIIEPAAKPTPESEVKEESSAPGV